MHACVCVPRTSHVSRVTLTLCMLAGRYMRKLQRLQSRRDRPAPPAPDTGSSTTVPTSQVGLGLCAGGARVRGGREGMVRGLVVAAVVSGWVGDGGGRLEVEGR